MARLSRRRGSLKFPNGGGGQPRTDVRADSVVGPVDLPEDTVEVEPEPFPTHPTLVVKKTKKAAKRKTIKRSAGF